MQRVDSCSLTSISELIDQKFLHPPKESNSFSLNQEEEVGESSARSITPIPAPSHYLQPEPVRLLPSRPTSPAIWPLISKTLIDLILS